MRNYDLKKLLLIGILAFTCMHYENDNPFDPLYPSTNYQFKVNWSMFPDPCYLKTDYIIGCTTSVGRDTFVSFSATIGEITIEVDIEFVCISVDYYACVMPVSV